MRSKLAVEPSTSIRCSTTASSPRRPHHPRALLLRQVEALDLDDGREGHAPLELRSTASVHASVHASHLGPTVVAGLAGIDDAVAAVARRQIGRAAGRRRRAARITARVTARVTARRLAVRVLRGLGACSHPGTPSPSHKPGIADHLRSPSLPRRDPQRLPAAQTHAACPAKFSSQRAGLNRPRPRPRPRPPTRRRRRSHPLRGCGAVGGLDLDAVDPPAVLALELDADHRPRHLLQRALRGSSRLSFGFAAASRDGLATGAEAPASTGVEQSSPGTRSARATERGTSERRACPQHAARRARAPLSLHEGRAALDRAATPRKIASRGPRRARPADPRPPAPRPTTATRGSPTSRARRPRRRLRRARCAPVSRARRRTARPGRA